VSDWRQVAIIARREFLERARSRVFLVTMGLIAVIIVGGIFLLSVVNFEGDATSLGIAGSSPDGLDADVEIAASAVDVEVEVTEYPTRADAVAAIEQDEIEAALIDGTTIIATNTPSVTIQTILAAAANAAVRRELASDLGLTGNDVAQILAPVSVSVEELEADDPGEDARAAASFLSAIILLTTILVFGQFVAMGIVEEKQNRVVEVVLAKVRTTSLLIGKVLGIGALGIVQIAAIGLAVVVGLAVAPIDDIGIPDLTSIGIVAVTWLGVWFVLGYLVYSFLYATFGATISRQEDMQSVAFIPALSIMPAYFLVVFTASSGGETTPLIRLASFVPLWSPIVMPYRINTGSAEPWEVVIAIVIVVVTIAVLVGVGARVYRGAALRTGSKVSLREAWSSASD
jgi:ABC-2 type transport system permease protein